MRCSLKPSAWFLLCRGYFGLFEFSSSFVRTDFIQADAEHIRGTECDQKILSKRGTSGQVFSPNYPFPYQGLIYVHSKGFS